MRTFFISTLGCKVNQYESEQIAALLRSHGLHAVDRAELADLRVVNTCSVTVQAASKSRQTARQVVRLPVLRDSRAGATSDPAADSTADAPNGVTPITDRQRVIITGCWATSDKADAERIPGVSAVLTHHDDVAAELDRLVDSWQTADDRTPPTDQNRLTPQTTDSHGDASRLAVDDGWMISAGAATLSRAAHNKPPASEKIKKNPGSGATKLPLLGERQAAHTRAFLKVQDGCDAHCTYCIIPGLRPRLWSKPVDELIDEARRMVDAGHAEVVLTGIFLGAYGQPTALRRRQRVDGARPIAQAIGALCTRVPGLRRLRLSSLEPGDLDGPLLDVLSAHAQVVPHFHLPLQSGSDAMLRRMNRQYTRDDFLRMLDDVHARFDRPAITTDVIVGFPGETDDEFRRTVEIAEHARFVHVHAFPFSPRPGTAAARWTRDFVRGPVVNERVDRLRALGDRFGLEFRRGFVGETVEVIVERPGAGNGEVRHGRTARYFPVWFDGPRVRPGDVVNVTVDRVTATRTHGALADGSLA